MALDERVSDLIGRIYEGVGAPDRWEAVLHEVRTVLGVRCLMQSVSDFDQSEMHKSSVIGDPHRPEGVHEYREHAYRLDDSFRWAIEHPNARFCDTMEIVPRESYLAQEFVQWNLNNWIGSTHWLAGYTPPADELTFGLSAHPWPQDGPLVGQKKRLFMMLFEHMERAIRLLAHPPLFGSTDQALVVLDRLGRIRLVTPAARELIDQRDGLTIWKDQLQAADSSSSALLSAAILSALSALREGGAGGAVALPRPSGKRNLLVTVTPLLGSNSPFEAFRPAALVRIIEPDATVSPSAAQHWSSLFGFSPAEARLAESLMSGDQNLRHAADQLGITYETARVHLKKLMEKTGTHSQSKLATLLSRIG